MENKPDLAWENQGWWRINQIRFVENQPDLAGAEKLTRSGGWRINKILLVGNKPHLARENQPYLAGENQKDLHGGK